MAPLMAPPSLRSLILRIDPIAIDVLLPQTQCTQCGFAGCMPYAEAMATGEAPINRCAPGGDEGIHALAAITGQHYAPLDPAHGIHQPRVLAVIDEERCIGCTICIQKCPVDAIAGAAKVMHTVIADECTGCELCVVPCPVDCIALVPMPASHPAIAARDAAAAIARERHRSRLARLARRDAERPQQTAASEDVEAIAGKQDSVDVGQPHAGDAVPIASVVADGSAAPIGSPAHKRAAIAAALARARARRNDVEGAGA